MWFYLWWCSKHASLHCICFKKTAKLPRKSIILRATLAYKLLWLLRIIQVFKRISEKDWKIFVLTSPSARHALVLFVELDISWSPILHNFLIFFNLWTKFWILVLLWTRGIERRMLYLSFVWCGSWLSKSRSHLRSFGYRKIVNRKILPETKLYYNYEK